MIKVSSYFLLIKLTIHSLIFYNKIYKNFSTLLTIFEIIQRIFSSIIIIKIIENKSPYNLFLILYMIMT